MRRYAAFTSDAQIVAIGRGMVERTLPKAQWTHAGHFAAVLWLLSTQPEHVVSEDLPGQIRAYNVSVGGENTDTAGYHETITQASIRAAAAWLASNGGMPLFESCNMLMDSPLGQPDWLLEYWSRSNLFSTEARLAWVPPDVRALPF